MKCIQKIMLSFALGVGIMSPGNAQAGFWDVIKKTTACIYYAGAQALRVGTQIGVISKINSTLSTIADIYFKTNPASAPIWRGLIFVCRALTKDVAPLAASWFLQGRITRFCDKYITNHKFLRPLVTNQDLYPIHTKIKTLGDYMADGFATTSMVPYLGSRCNGIRLACAPLVGYAQKVIVPGLLSKIAMRMMPQAEEPAAEPAE